MTAGTSDRSPLFLDRFPLPEEAKRKIREYVAAEGVALDEVASQLSEKIGSPVGELGPQPIILRSERFSQQNEPREVSAARHEWSLSLIRSAARVLTLISKEARGDGRLIQAGPLWDGLNVIAHEFLPLYEDEKIHVWSLSYPEFGLTRLAWWLEPYDPRNQWCLIPGAAASASISPALPKVGVPVYQNEGERYSREQLRERARFGRRIQTLCCVDHCESRNKLQDKHEELSAGAHSIDLIMRIYEEREWHEKNFLCDLTGTHFKGYIETLIRLRGDFELSRGGMAHEIEDRFNKGTEEIIGEAERVHWRNALGCLTDRDSKLPLVFQQVDFAELARGWVDEVRQELVAILESNLEFRQDLAVFEARQGAGAGDSKQLETAAPVVKSKGGRPPALRPVEGKAITALQGNLTDKAFAGLVGIDVDTLRQAKHEPWLAIQSTIDKFNEFAKSASSEITIQNLEPKKPK